MNFDPSWLKYDIFSIIQKPTKTIIIICKNYIFNYAHSLP